MTKFYPCPVCGYSELERPPIDDTICPSCGTQFGYDDHVKSWDELRVEWIQHGAKWFSDYIRPPQNWNTYMQILSRPSTATGDSFNEVLLGYSGPAKIAA